MRWVWVGSIVCLFTVGAVWGGWYWFDEKRFQQTLEQAETDFTGGRYHLARQRLSVLTRQRPGSSEATYQLGLCEEKLGHFDAALRAWSEVAPDSALYIQASIGRVLVLMNSGRFSQAEELLASLPRGKGPYAGHLQQQFQDVLRTEGRMQECRRLIAQAWPGSSDPPGVLKGLHLLETSPFPVDFVKEAIKRGPADDDRIWLAQAHLAIWAGRFADAARWLDACEKKRPDDQAIWLMRLSLAMSSQDPKGARRALEHVRSSWFLRHEVLRIRSWLAAFAGDPEVERKSLMALTAVEPGNTNAWARLAELAQAAGQDSEARRFREKQAEATALHARYNDLISRDENGGFAGELAPIAERLGRPMEARGWFLIERGKAADEPLWPETGPPGPKDEVLASLMEDPTPRPNQTTAQRPVGVPVIPPEFADDADEAGLHFVHENGHQVKNIPPTQWMCGGVGLLDYDGDGWLDAYVVQGGEFPATGSPSRQGDRLFRNRGDGTFEDTTERSHIASFSSGFGHGVAIGDYDNDGRPDVFVTRWNSYALYRNRGDGTFDDVTSGAGLAGSRDWPTSAAFADLDSDGDLDLYVCHYLLFDPASPKVCPPADPTGYHSCLPRDFPSLADHVFRNDRGRFVDVTSAAGFTDPDGRGLGVVAADFDDDNKIDLYVANDMSANYLFHNRGGFRFEETGQSSGAALSADGVFKAGMGVACGDLDGDGELDLAVTNFFGESTTFFRNLGAGLFADHTGAIGLLAPSRPLLGFGVAFVDVNNDGWLDLLSTNGHVIDSRPRIPLAMPLQLLTGSPGGNLKDVSERAGDPFGSLHLGRGLAIGDLDNDGRMDALVVNQNEPLVYLHNRTEKPGHFIRFSLEGTKSNRDGVGARVTITAGGRRRMAERIGGGSYQSANDPRLHFGLGEAGMVESVEVRWPSGQVDRYLGLLPDHEYRLREAAKSPRATEVRSPRISREAAKPQG
jgi:enediyne biosynthesis protein E4